MQDVNSDGNIYYNFQIKNDSESPKLVDQTDVLSNALLSDSQQFNLDIFKFSLPFQQIPVFLITDNSEYEIRLGGMINDTTTGYPMKEITGSALLPTTATYPIYSANDYVEAWNRTALIAYKNLLQNVSDYVTGSVENKYGAFDINVTSPAYVYNQTVTINPGDYSMSDGRLCYLRLGLKMSTTAPRTTCPMRVYLINPAGVSTLVYSGYNNSSNKWIYFEDGALDVLEKKMTNMADPIPEGTYQPVEPFTKLKSDSDQKGNWTIKVQSMQFAEDAGSIDFTDIHVDYHVGFYFRPMGRINQLVWSQYAPVLGINDSNKLELMIHESYYYSAFSIYLSSRVFNNIGFPGSMYSNGLYRLALGFVSLSGSLDPSKMIRFEQSQSTVYRLRSIRSIQIRSNSLSVQGEFSSVTGTDIIMAIEIASDTVLDRLDWNGSYRRFYALNGNVDLRRINFSVFAQYDNQETESRVFIPPKSVFTLSIALIPKTSSFN
jgi:hypothetical protein